LIRDQILINAGAYNSLMYKSIFSIHNNSLLVVTILQPLKVSHEDRLIQCVIVYIPLPEKHYFKADIFATATVRSSQISKPAKSDKVASLTTCHCSYFEKILTVAMPCIYGFVSALALSRFALTRRVKTENQYFVSRCICV